MVKPSLKGKKKKWFVVKAGELYKNAEIGEILAYELKDTLSRKITINYSNISQNPRDQKTKLKFKVEKTKSDECIANPISMFIQDSFVHQRIKRDKTRNILVFKTKSKEGKNIKVKIIYSSKNKLSRAINSRILKNLENLFKELINSTESEKLFDVDYIQNKTNELRKQSNNVYPIDKLYIWKLLIV